MSFASGAQETTFDSQDHATKIPRLTRNSSTKIQVTERENILMKYEMCYNNHNYSQKC